MRRRLWLLINYLQLAREIRNYPWMTSLALTDYLSGSQWSQSYGLDRGRRTWFWHFTSERKFLQFFFLVSDSKRSSFYLSAQSRQRKEARGSRKLFSSIISFGALPPHFSGDLVWEKHPWDSRLLLPACTPLIRLKLKPVQCQIQIKSLGKNSIKQRASEESSKLRKWHRGRVGKALTFRPCFAKALPPPKWDLFPCGKGKVLIIIYLARLQAKSRIISLRQKRSHEEEVLADASVSSVKVSNSLAKSKPPLIFSLCPGNTL